MTWNNPTSKDGLKGWQRVDQGLLFPPESEVVTPTTGAGVNTTTWVGQKGRDVLVYLESTADQQVTCQPQFSYDGSTWFNGPATIVLAAGNVTPQRNYYTFSDTHPFHRLNAVAGGAIGSGTLKATLTARAMRA